ncbi:MAG: 5'-3' exonuclease H3TH domain-containing protein [Candidatus Pacebacteria bacterium]|nr:5'-3' exonuclease H3TH domain-containing protein [Candidatus Paceibacterota bacterium]
MGKDNFVIIDSNSIIHRAFHALPPLKRKDGMIVNAVYGFLLVLFKLIKELKPKYLVACFDLPEPTFRKQAFEQYKAHRKKAPQELYDQIPVIKKVLKIFNVPIFEKPGYEGDDLIGTLSNSLTKGKGGGVSNIVVSGDLDNLQLINDNTSVYFLTKGIKNTVLLNEEGVRNKYDGLTPKQLIDYKGLRGDPSDNIPGVKGIGEKTAIKLIKEFDNIENLYNKLDAAEIPLKVKEKLIQNKDNAFLSKTLSEIKTDVPIEVNMKDCEWGGYDEKEAIEMLKSFNFNSLIKNISTEEKSIGQNLKLW